jgi:hypothetical protein
MKQIPYSVKIKPRLSGNIVDENRKLAAVLSKYWAINVICLLSLGRLHCLLIIVQIRAME